ncbi:hypothetical protein ACA910_004962 [Epithemia clementina (nom. ined.)]
MYFPTQTQKIYHTLRKTVRRAIPLGELPPVSETQESIIEYSDSSSEEEEDEVSSPTTNNLPSSLNRNNSTLFSAATINNTFNIHKRKFDEPENAPSQPILESNNLPGPFSCSDLQNLEDFNYMKERVAQLELKMQRTDELEREVLCLCRLVNQLKHKKHVMKNNFSQYFKEDGNCKTSQPDIPKDPILDSNYKMKGTDLLEVAEKFVNALCLYLIDTTKSTLYAERIPFNIADLIWDESLLNGLLVDKLMSHARSLLSKTDFAPHKILCAMDTRGGVLNYEGLEIIRQCETRGKRYARNTVIPSVAQLRKVASVIQQYGDIKFPYEHKHAEGIGENIRFNPLCVIKAAINLAGLQDAAKRQRIQLVELLDGAKFSKHLNFVMFGVKSQDLFAKDAESGELVAT